MRWSCRGLLVDRARSDHHRRTESLEGGAASRLARRHLAHRDRWFGAARDRVEWALAIRTGGASRPIPARDDEVAGSDHRGGVIG